MTRTSILHALLAICLVAAPAFAQDGDGSTDLPEACFGEWAFDVDRLIAEDPEMQAMDKEQRAAMEAMVRQMLSAASVKIEAGKMTMMMMGQEQVSTIEVISCEGNVYKLAVTNPDGQVQDGKMTVVDANTLGLESEGRTLWLKRKGATDDGSATTPTPTSPKDIALGEWGIHAERTAALKATDDMSDEDKAMLLKGLQQQAKILKITITESELKMEALIGEFSQSNEFEIVEVVEGSEGEPTVLKIRVKTDETDDEGNEIWDDGVITIHDEDIIEVEIEGDGFVLQRREEGDKPEVTVTGKHAELLGLWTTDIAATVRAADRNAGKTEEELKAEIEQATMMTAAMGLKYEFTAEAFIVHMSGNKVPQATYKVLGEEGNVLKVEMTTLDGDVRTGTITINGDKAVLDTGDGEPMHMNRVKADGDDEEDDDDDEDGSEDGDGE